HTRDRYAALYQPTAAPTEHRALSGSGPPGQDQGGDGARDNGATREPMTNDEDRLRRELRATTAVNRQLLAQLDAKPIKQAGRKRRWKRKIRKAIDRVVAEGVRRGWIRQPADEDVAGRLKHRIRQIEARLNRPARTGGQGRSSSARPPGQGEKR
ncbi:MAG: hypothetical protein JJU45_20220, partial [Acidimicrobiia bacterium]|nr:hypothetical protein [Acidimicrobiia bacterium]